MVNSVLVAASLKSIEEILKENDIPYELDENEAYKGYMEAWENFDDKALLMRQARPALKRIVSKEPYVFAKSGAPLIIRFNNDKDRRLKKDSFAELLLERPDMDWRISLSVKSSAKVIATMPVADRDMEHTVIFNEIDDFGDRIFGVPCSNEYFDDVNEILEKISSSDKEHWRENWRELIKDDKFVYDTVIKPMLRAVGAEIARICKDHPEAPQKLIDYFYGKIDYYYINPIEEVQATRIGAVNSRRGLGRIPDNDNLYTPSVKFPTQLLDVRFANGRYGELSKDTIQISFDGGWAICISIIVKESEEYGRNFAMNVYLPVTPFGSYRDQVDWEPEA